MNTTEAARQSLVDAGNRMRALLGTPWCNADTLAAAAAELHSAADRVSRIEWQAAASVGVTSISDSYTGGI